MSFATGSASAPDALLKQVHKFPEVESSEKSKSDPTSSTKDIVASKDAGNKPCDHYKSRLSTLRYTLRGWCLPIVRKETEWLSTIQSKTRTPWLDFYFAWTANLASHTFYVLMLPLPAWFGGLTILRDLVHVLGYGIFFTGFLKDFLCLPRPRSPPLHRITMSSYTTQEYGWPLSHSANATAVTLVLFTALMKMAPTLSHLSFLLLSALFILYYLSLIVGRLYCGMHGFFDILTGACVGIVMFLYRHFYGEAFDNWLLHSSRNDSILGILATAFIIIFGNLFLIHIYPEPVDDCPCFDDSVAFVGVIIGLDLTHYAFILTETVIDINGFRDPLMIPYLFSQLGLPISLARVAWGVLVVVTWKTLSKPVIFTVLPPLYKYIGIYLPRNQFTATAHTKTPSRYIRSQSLSNMKDDKVLDVKKALKSVVESDADRVGPTDDIDAYELLDYQSSHPTEKQPEEIKISGVFKKRYDVEIIGRIIVYAGIPFCATWVFRHLADYLGILH